MNDDGTSQNASDGSDDIALGDVIDPESETVRTFAAIGDAQTDLPAGDEDSGEFEVVERTEHVAPNWQHVSGKRAPPSAVHRLRIEGGFLYVIDAEVSSTSCFVPFSPADPIAASAGLSIKRSVAQQLQPERTQWAVETAPPAGPRQYAPDPEYAPPYNPELRYAEPLYPQNPNPQGPTKAPFLVEGAQRGVVARMPADHGVPGFVPGTMMSNSAHYVPQPPPEPVAVQYTPEQLAMAAGRMSMPTRVSQPMAPDAAAKARVGVLPGQHQSMPSMTALPGYLQSEDIQEKFGNALVKRLIARPTSANGWYVIDKIIDRQPAQKKPPLWEVFGGDKDSMGAAAAVVMANLGYEVQGGAIYAPDKPSGRR